METKLIILVNHIFQLLLNDKVQKINVEFGKKKIELLRTVEQTVGYSIKISYSAGHIDVILLRKRLNKIQEVYRNNFHGNSRAVDIMF